MADDTENGVCKGGATETDATQTIFADWNTFMTNNTATQSGADIYGGLHVGQVFNKSKC